MVKTSGKSTFRKIADIALNVLFCCFFILCAIALFLTITSKKSEDGAMRIFGFEMRIVLSSSMEKCDETDVSAYEIKDIPVKSVVFIQTVPEDDLKAEEWYSSLKVGDVLTFKYVYATQETITHRITDIQAKEDGGYIITLSGDNKAASGGTLTQTIDTSQDGGLNYIIGKVTGTSYFLGLVISALKSAWGIIFIVIVPCFIIIIFEAIKIAEALRERKNSERDAEDARKDAEIAELKRRLEEVTADRDAASPSVTDDVSEQKSHKEITRG